MDPPRLARYPFLPEARAMLEEEGPPLGRLLEGRAWSSARARGTERVVAAVDTERARPEIHAASDHEALVDICSYVVARLLVSVVDERLVTNRFASEEGERVAELLVDEPDEVLLAVTDELGLPVEPRGGRTDIYEVPFQAYLRATKDLSAIEWKLVNRTVDSGRVLLERRHIVRLAREALKLRLVDELPLDLPSDVRERLGPMTKPIESALADLRSGRADLEYDEVRPEVFPPCMRSIINAIHAGENVSHEGRFAIVAFLHTIGMDRDAIINELFPNVPDFAKEVTEYQVDHITGAKNKEAYTPPGCSSLQTYGLCPMLERAKEDWDDWCAHEKMNHPLTYYRWGLFTLEKKGEREAEGADQEDSGTASEGDEDGDDEASEAGATTTQSEADRS